LHGQEGDKEIAGGEKAKVKIKARMLAWNPVPSMAQNMDGFGIDHRYRDYHSLHNQFQYPTFSMPPPQQRYQQQVQQQQQQQQQQLQQQPRALRKRKADAPPENNERLSKRMSLLNLGTLALPLHPPN